MFVTLHREHIRFFNQAIGEFMTKMREEEKLGRISHLDFVQPYERLQSLRNTLRAVGNITLDEQDYRLIRNYIEADSLISN